MKLVSHVTRTIFRGLDFREIATITTIALQKFSRLNFRQFWSIIFGHFLNEMISFPALSL